MTYQLHEFPTDSELIDSLAPMIAQQLKQAIASRSHATLAVSGGKTPINLFSALSEQNVLWDRVTVTLIDERWVDSRHADANAGLVKEYLLAGQAKRATFISLKAPYDSPYDSVQTISKRIEPILPIDVAILGMGADGHTASFFPDADTLDEAMDPNGDNIVCAVTPPNAPHERMTLTLPVILNSHAIFLHIVGDEKRRVLQDAIDNHQTTKYPISAIVNHPEKLVEIFFAEEA
ncbi:6-phosphogluconolactonase [Aurantivibrio plasticivorans]